MLELLTGTGLATSAGLNAWIPLLLVGLTARYTDLLTLPPTWDWLDSNWALAILTVLLVTELVADKVPVLDSVNDVAYTILRPASGGIAFGAGSATGTGDEAGGGWLPVAVGAALALVVHVLKALTRTLVNATTLGFGAPVVSTVEDLTSAAMSLVAIVLPVLVLCFLTGLGLFFWWAMRRRARRRAARQAARQAARRVVPPG